MEYRKKYNNIIIRILPVLILLGSVVGMKAQFYNGSNMTFGKNRVQYNKFLWLFYKFDDFDTYFYLNGRELAEFTARYSTIEIPKMESKIESRIDKRLQFIIFNNLTDLKQSNIGLMTEESYNTGGITHIIGSKIFLYFDGNHVNFEKQIRAGIAQVLFNQMMFGGSLGQQVKTSTFFSIPEWYRVGIISYLSKDWDVEFDNRVRDGILSGRYKKVNNLSGKDAVYAGHSLWRYISGKYGKASVANIIHMTSVSNSIDKGFLYVIGVPFKSLIKEWRAHYEKEYEKFAGAESHPEQILPIRYKEDIVYGQPNISPDGKYLAYTSNEMGKFKIYLYDMLKGKKKKIYKRGVMIDTKTDYSYPLLAWHPTGKMLAIMLEHKGKPWLYMYSLEKNKLIKKKFAKQPIYEMQKITDMSYADNGRFMVMSAVKKGQSDIYVFNIAASSFHRITDDLYSELNPRFINNSSQIVFSSNRENDTIGLEPEIMDDVPDNFDLFVYDYANRNKVLRRITDTPLADEIKPESNGFNTISYLSNENGIVNSFMAIIDSTVSSVDTAIHYRYFVHSKPVTDYSRNIKDQHSSDRAGKRAFIYYEDNYTKIFYDQIPDFSTLPQLELTDTKYMASIRSEWEKEKARQEKLSLKQQDSDLAETETPKVTRPKTKLKRFQMVYLDSKGREIIGMPDGKRKGKGKYDLFVDEYGSGDLEFILPKRQNYRVEYFLNDVISQIDFNYLNYGYQTFTGGGGPIYLNPGFNLFFQFGVNDLMEDHRFVGGVRLNFSLTNNEYLFSYANLKRRLDQEIVFHRNSIEGYISGTPYYGTIHTHELFYMLKWPFNEALSLRGTATFRSDMKVVLATDQISLEFPTVYDNWGGIKGELVFDNTRNPSMNILYGTRWKFFAEYHQLLNAINRNMVVIGFDVRKYIRIHRTFIWANRIAGSTSLGNENLIYYMGGVDNWLFPKFDPLTPIDYSQNYAFQTLATNMRGFNQNIRNGNSFLVFNTELRFPIFQYFSKSPMSSSFLRNFQLVAFGDIGTAWTGPSPYSPENSLFTRYVHSGPLLISVEIQKEPIVAGYGFGARIHLLGYYIRGDVAWGIEDYQINRPVYYLSLSLDF